MLKRLAMKYWPLILLLILTVAVLGMSRYAEKRKAENQESTQVSRPQTPITPLKTDQGAEKADKSKHPPTWIDTFTWPEGVTAWALFLTLFVIAWQSVETHAAAKSGEDAAEIALANTKTLINVERPWLVMAIERDKELKNLFRMKAVNRGRTPAQIISISDGCLIAPVRDKLPIPPEYIRVKTLEATDLLIQGEYQTIFEYSRDHLRMAIDDSAWFDCVCEGTHFAYIFGKILYRDLIASKSVEPHETAWCCILLLGSDGEDHFFFTDGQSGYTKHQ
jgi:hypothetical protein